MVLARFRRLLGLKPPYHAARQKLEEVIAGGQLSPDDLLNEKLGSIETLCAWDSWFEGPDWVELEAWAEKLGLDVKTVRDLVRLLESIDQRYRTK